MRTFDIETLLGIILGLLQYIFSSSLDSSFLSSIAPNMFWSCLWLFWTTSVLKIEDYHGAIIRGFIILDQIVTRYQFIDVTRQNTFFQHYMFLLFRDWIEDFWLLLLQLSLQRHTVSRTHFSSYYEVEVEVWHYGTKYVKDIIKVLKL